MMAEPADFPRLIHWSGSGSIKGVAAVPGKPPLPKRSPRQHGAGRVNLYWPPNDFKGRGSCLGHMGQGGDPG